MHFDFVRARRNPEVYLDCYRVFRYRCLGWTLKQIADELQISVSSAHKYWNETLDDFRLGFHDLVRSVKAESVQQALEIRNRGYAMATKKDATVRERRTGTLMWDKADKSLYRHLDMGEPDPQADDYEPFVIVAGEAPTEWEYAQLPPPEDHKPPQVT